MDFTKFYALINNSKLYFPSALQLAEMDPFEGSFAKGNMSKGNSEYRIFQRDRMRRTIYISSWYMNEYESAAMWKIYSNEGSGIAIRSTVDRIKSAIQPRPKSEFVGPDDATFIGRIEYLDYEVDTVTEGNRLGPFLNKRKSFEHEREVRVIKWDSSEINRPSPLAVPDGIYVPLDLHILIESVFVAPNTPNWVQDLVETILRQANIKNEVVKSRIRDGGLW
jgi:hypothetical protein